MSFEFCALKIVGGAVASWLVSSTPDRASGFETWPRKNCVVFMGKTLNSHGALFTKVYKWVPANLVLGG